MIKKLFRRLESIIALAQSILTPKQFIFLSSVLVGISCSFAVIILKAFAHNVFSFATYISGILKLGFINSILPIIGILLTVLVVKKVLNGSIQKGTSQILYAVAKKASIIPRKQMYAQIVTSSLTVGLGGSAGLESPIVITGAAFGSNYAQNYKLAYKDRTLLIGCGVAAGISAAFNAPIAGVLFAIEVLLVDVSISAFTPIMISAATGALVSAIVLDESILLSFKKQETFDYHNIPFYVILGLITGFMAVYYARNFQRVEHYFSELKMGPYKKALIGSSLLALLIFIFPTLFGEGYESIKTLSESDPGQLLDNTLFATWRNNNWVLLLFIGCTMMVKVFASGLTLGSGGNGGNFAPSLFLGSYLGYFFSKLVTLTGLSKLPITNFTMVGMAGILSGLFHAPLTAIFLIAEITGGYGLMIPLMIVSSISFAISKRFEKYSLDVKNLAKKGHAFTSNKDSNILSTLDIDTIIQTDYLTVSPEDHLSKLVDLISHSNQVVFAVVNNDRDLVGIVHFNDIREIIFNAYRVKYTLIKDVMKTPAATISSNDSMEIVMTKFERSKSAFLPVLRNDKYFGIISKSIALEAYRMKLRSMTIE
ncbi:MULTISPECIES: chloride channel protein [Flavobacterium]|jgi:CIC family chloride channel protein|uniref:Cl-channel, voltage-gated family protein n=1 Tax=Flavobacterium johnsoniae (strain ATCC 17061 / DSM 2064 / JCM 8514 / BCRC 14874 / CCUG 350202 / NBRC 14942 / NCIMB 11054 / UW101) TaxID=376686 RepID=A5FBB2_FLAJ1|nr:MULTISPECIES: chloride channel protein [Flavobacterium]ABQ07506.1 Cl- channel, voltage-gated family protein [Flavobacterium johnsoniae UW101]OXE99408.1 chloride channel protein [Flavobacterium johnsoniae UW101]WDF58244.1 chloride channel protein [Flavobacterium sp. KACC 22758]WQG80655.1 chloride channel protein [Flavobacterium johnsoniae UW101]SHL10849.1 chloride channel protein, CIC family [Flavobacterium johnsoniae]